MTEGRVTPALRSEVSRRARELCEYCRSPAEFATNSFSVEHIVPISAGGATVTENLALACQGCNNHKYTKISAVDPVSGDPVSIFHPRTHAWLDHFRWDDTFTLMIGITAIGRATVNALRLNRPNLVSLRQLLVKAGKHPPAD